MARWIIKLAVAIAVASVLSHSVLARQADEQPQAASIIASDKAIGAEVRLAGGKKLSTVKDFAIQLDEGGVLLATLDSGVVVPADSLEWQAEGEFFLMRQPTAPGDGLKIDAKGSRTLMLSKLHGVAIIGKDSTSDGVKRKKIGTVGGSFIDTASGMIAFVGTSIGGEILGIGAESRIIPWGALDPRLHPESGDVKLVSSITPRRLEKGPVYGSGSDKIYNPSYRRALYSYYGADRPDFDRVKDGRHIMTLRRIIGAKVMQNDRKVDTVKDLLVDVHAGNFPFVILGSGMMVSSESLDWDYQRKRFEWNPKESKGARAAKGHTVLASALDDFEIQVEGKAYGSPGTIYMDTKDNSLQYLTVVVGTTLGLGGEVKVFPWGSVTVMPPGTSRSGALRINLSRETAKTAPSLDGSQGADLYNPDFRARVDALIDDASN